MSTKNEVIIVGAGPAGIGVAILLKKMNIPFVVLERYDIGSSFLNWPEEMRFISPSFTGNFFGSPDLNAITPDTSPAYSLQTEHPTGKQYAEYLFGIADFHKIPVQKECDIYDMKKDGDIFKVKTSQGDFESKYVVWAGGEFQYPNDEPFEGAEECIHNSHVRSWEELKGNSFVVVGAYESGIDAAYQLAKLGKKVTVFDEGNEFANEQSDSSYSLSPFTRDRYSEHKDSIQIKTGLKVTSVEKVEDKYKIHLENGEVVESKTQPILATGFISSVSVVADLFEEGDGHVLLSEEDESTKTQGLFLAGPQVQHGGAVFCFIYKYRQRFPVVAEEIAKRLGKEKDAEPIIEEYKRMNFYLKDLTHCDDECAC